MKIKEKKTSRIRKERTSRETDGQKKESIREQRRRQRRRRVLRIRAAIAGGVLLVVLASVAGFTLMNREKQEKKAKEKQELLVKTDVLKVPHLSFDTLVVNAEAAGSDGITVDEFNQMLQTLYEQDYILVSIHDLAEVSGGESGTMQPADLELPEGKKPLVISQNDVSYPLTLPTGGYASRLLVDESGTLVSEYHQTDGTVVTGAYDVVSCLEAFLKEHPDFSWQGARGILGISGSSGILGYRTDEIFGKTEEEGNPYAAAYGTFDTAAETEEAKTVLQALRDSGWEIACQGYSGISYASEYDLVTADMEQWKQKTEPVAGSTDILLYPQGTDIASWKDYSEENQKFAYLKEQGFDYFCNLDPNPYWVQIRDTYLRQGRIEARNFFSGESDTDTPESLETETIVPETQQETDTSGEETEPEE